MKRRRQKEPYLLYSFGNARQGRKCTSVYDRAGSHLGKGLQSICLQWYHPLFLVTFIFWGGRITQSQRIGFPKPSCEKQGVFKPWSIVSWAFLIAQLIKNLLAMQETLVLSLGQADWLEKG